MRLPPEFQEDDATGRGLVFGIIGGILFWIAAIALVFFATGCVSRLYDKGQLTAEIRGDYEYRKAADGSVSVSLSHTPVIQASGTAIAKDIGAAGSAGSILKLTP